jgi:hypothetical protein
MENTILPLFNSLKNKMENKILNLNDDDILKLSDIINKDLDKEGYELLYIIIRYYSILEDDLNINELPYKSKTNKGGIKFNLNYFPKKLIYIIYYFIELHTKKMFEEKQREIKNNL